MQVWHPPVHKENSSEITGVTWLPGSFIWDWSKFLLLSFLNVKILNRETEIHSDTQERGLCGGKKEDKEIYSIERKGNIRWKVSCFSGTLFGFV